MKEQSLFQSCWDLTRPYCTVLIDVVSIIDKATLYCIDRCGQYN